MMRGLAHWAPPSQSLHINQWKELPRKSLRDGVHRAKPLFFLPAGREEKKTRWWGRKEGRGNLDCGGHCPAVIRAVGGSAPTLFLDESGKALWDTTPIQCLHNEWWDCTTSTASWQLSKCYHFVTFLAMYSSAVANDKWTLKYLWALDIPSWLKQRIYFLEWD